MVTPQEKRERSQEEFKQAQKTAEENKKGLWADGACQISPKIE